MIDARYVCLKSRLSSFSKKDLQYVLLNIDRICFDTLNYDEANKTFCPVAMAMRLDSMSSPTQQKVFDTIAERFTFVNVMHGCPGEFYRGDHRKQDLEQVLLELINETDAK